MPLVVNVFLIAAGLLNRLRKLPAVLFWKAVAWFVPPIDRERQGEDGQPR